MAAPARAKPSTAPRILVFSTLPDCSARASRIVSEAQALLRQNGYEPRRVRMGAICSVCADPFAAYLREFAESLAELAPSERE
jgi:coenzyme F420-reducing hydrogenase delta subunit